MGEHFHLSPLPGFGKDAVGRQLALISGMPGLGAAVPYVEQQRGRSLQQAEPESNLGADPSAPGAGGGGSADNVRIGHGGEAVQGHQEAVTRQCQKARLIPRAGPIC